MDGLRKAFAWVEENSGEAVAYLQRLVRIPSVNPWFTEYKEYTTEGDFQRDMAEYLAEMGFAVQLWEVDGEALRQYEGMPGYYEGRPMRDRPNLLATLKGTGGGRSLLLTGHADVVKVGQGWTKDPFGGEVENGRLYGRGAVDMKGGIAAMVMAVKALQQAGIPLRGDVLVGTVPDEEAGGMGSLDIVHSPHYQVADGAIMTEPTSLAIGPMCRGILWGKIVIPGRAGHIEMAQGHWSEGGAVDAVRLAQLYLAGIDAFNRDWAGRKTHPMLPMPCQLIVAGVHAGEYPSAYAGSAEISFNAQYLPRELDEKFRGSTVKREIEEFVANLAQTDGWLRQNPPYVEWLLDADCAETPADSPFVQAMAAAAKKAGKTLPVKAITCHTDMGWYVRKGTPTINFGAGDPKIAHQPDEYVDLEEYLESIKILAAMILEWCG